MTNSRVKKREKFKLTIDTGSTYYSYHLNEDREYILNDISECRNGNRNTLMVKCIDGKVSLIPDSIIQKSVITIE